MIPLESMPPEETSLRAKFSIRSAQYADNLLVSFAVSAIFTLLMMRSRIFPLGALLFDTGIEGQDCGQMAWNLWHTCEAITHGHNPYFTNRVFYPISANLSHHTLAAGYFPITFLVKFLSGNSPMYPLYTYRIIIWLAFTLILYCSYYALREFGASRMASAISAVAYAFCGFYILHALHLNHLAGFFIPLTALCLARVYKKATTGNLLAAALASSCAIYFTEFTLYIYMATLCFVAAMCLFPQERKTLLEKMRAAGVKRILLALFVFVLVIAPFVSYLLTDKIINPPVADSSVYSANLAGFFIPHKATTLLYGNLFAALDSRVTAGIGGLEVFIGFPSLIFAVVGLAKARNRFALIAFGVALVFFALSLGTTLKVFSVDTGIDLPYALLVRVPPFDSGRTPVRFVAVALFFLTIIAARGMSWMERSVKARHGARWSTACMLLLFAWVTAETYSPAARQRAFVPPTQLEKLVPGAVLNLPVMEKDGYASLMQTFHHQPIATGYLARNSVRQRDQFLELRRAFDMGGAKFCEQASAMNFRNLLITPDRILASPLPSMAPLELSKCKLNVVDLRSEGRAAPNANYVLDENGVEQPARFTPYIYGTRLDFASAQTEPYLWYGWSVREPASRWTDRGAATIVFALDKPQTCVLRFSTAAFLAPGKLDAQRVDVEINNQSIAHLKLTNNEAQTISIDVPIDVLRKQNVLTIRVPDAATPESLQVSGDTRLLGINVHWIELEAKNSAK